MLVKVDFSLLYMNITWAKLGGNRIEPTAFSGYLRNKVLF